MKHLSLFSGIGGLDLAAEWAGFETIAFVERDPYCQRVLARRWPGVPIIADVRLVTDAAHHGPCGWAADSEVGERSISADQQGGHADVWSEPVGRSGAITLVSGGFPCQPHSVAGKRQASADDRDLWPEVARVLREIRPRWFVGENVRGLLHSESGRFFGRVLGDLADLGYRVGWGVWGASDVGALHRRDRIFIVAYAEQREGRERYDAGDERRRTREAEQAGMGGSDVADSESGIRLGRAPGEEGHASLGREDVADTERCGPSGSREPVESGGAAPACDREATRPEYGGFAELWRVEPHVGRVADGVPSRVDRLRALGNAVVPQQAYPLFKQIAEIERCREKTQG